MDDSSHDQPDNADQRRRTSDQSLSEQEQSAERDEDPSQEQSSINDNEASSTSGREAASGSTSNDPWSMMYGGNIAAACQATNEAALAAQPDPVSEDVEKQRQRASNRLIAWQSRERKRIEVEVLKERKEILESHNEQLKKENQQLRELIQRQKQYSRLRESNQTSLSSRDIAGAISRMTQGNPFFQPSFPPTFPPARAAADVQVPSLLGGADNLQANLLLQNSLHPYVQTSNFGTRRIMAPTVIAPLPRQTALHPGLLLRSNVPGPVSLERNDMQANPFKPDPVAAVAAAAAAAAASSLKRQAGNKNESNQRDSSSVGRSKKRRQNDHNQYP